MSSGAGDIERADEVEAAQRVVADRYRLERTLGGGGQGVTYLGRDLDKDTDVLVKRFVLEATDDWKAAELFDRAASVLETLAHPAIPAYRDHFKRETDEDVELFLVREMVRGESLQDCIEQGRSFDEQQLEQILHELLDALDYLHSRSPPVVHRDIKPANIILQPDGSVSLVDFGSVQAELLTETGGSTIVGTAGYVAPEQLMGKASAASDIYSLGVTMVHLMTHTPPTELPSDGFELEFESVLETSGRFEQVLRAMTAVDSRERLSSAAAVREALENSQWRSALAKRRPGRLVEVPRGSKLEAVEQDGDLVIRTPSKVLYWKPDSAARWGKMVIYSLSAALVSVPALVILSIALVQAWAPVWTLVVGPLVLLLAFAFIWSRRRRLAVTFGDEQLHIQQPPFRPRPTGGQKRNTVKGHRIRTSEIWINRASIHGASVIRETQGGGTEDVWMLRIACAQAQTNQPAKPLSSKRRVIPGAVILELNLTHGEYIWLARQIEAYASKPVLTRPGLRHELAE